MNDADRQSIDWGAARERVAETQRAIDSVFLADPERHGALLKERAARLAARNGQKADQAADELVVMTFLLGTERYGLEISALSAVGSPQTVSPVPGAGSALIGLFTARGEVWPLYDLPILLGHDPGEPRNGGYVLFLRDWSRRTALRVGPLLGTDRLDRTHLVAPPSGRDSENHVSGMSDDGLIVLDPSSLRNLSDLAKRV